MRLCGDRSEGCDFNGGRAEGCDCMMVGLRDVIVR